MKTLLYIGVAGNQYWRKAGAHWQPVVGAQGSPTWVVTDLAEETFAELRMPRLFGRDRRDYLERQVANQFSQTPYRTAFAWPRAGSLSDRLARSRYVLLGVDAATRIDAALAALDGHLVGVWSTSMLLAQWAQEGGARDDGFVVMPVPDRMRIVFLSQGQPVLTRLVSGVDGVSEQVAEIVRTLRHLENTRLVERSGQRLVVRVLGPSDELVQPLAVQGLDLLSPAAASSHPAPVLLSLFDRAMRMPKGQLAPVSLRQSFLAQVLRRAAYGVAVVALALAGVDAALNLRAMLAAREALQQVQVQDAQVRAQTRQVDLTLARWNVSAATVRTTLEQDAREVAQAPTPGRVLTSLSDVVSAHPALRVSRLQWRVLVDDQTACARVGATNPPSSVASALVTELQWDATGLAQSPPRERARILADVSTRIQAWPGVQLLTDPAQAMVQGKLDSTEQSAPDSPSSWCLRWSLEPAPARKGSTP